MLNFDLPNNSEDYVHRIGRTGRAGRYGKAISFVTSSQKADVKKIERLIRKSLPVLSMPTLPPERKQPRGAQDFAPRKNHSASQGRRNHSFQNNIKRSPKRHSNRARRSVLYER